MPMLLNCGALCDNIILNYCVHFVCTLPLAEIYGIVHIKQQIISKGKDDKKMNKAQSKSKLTKVLSLILALVMVLSLMPLTGFTKSSGEAVDGYKYNIMFLDCGRKYFSVDSIKTFIDDASAAGFNYIQLAVGNDGMRFLLDDMSLTVNGTTYTSKQVSDAIQAGNSAYNGRFDDKKTEDDGKIYSYNPTTNELTQSEMDTIIAYATSKGVGIIPCINTPGHMDAILSAASSLTSTDCSYNSSVTTIDVTNKTAVEFTKAFLQKYITYFANKGCKLFNMGADEYANDIYTSGSMGFGHLQNEKQYGSYVTYVNNVAEMIKDAGMTPMAFNDGIYFNDVTNSGTFDTGILICYWSNGWSGYYPRTASNLVVKDGFKLINTNGSYYYVLGKTAKCSAETAKKFDINSFPSVSTGTDTVSRNVAGSMFCIWCDYPGSKTEAEVISGTKDTIAAFQSVLPAVSAVSTDSSSTDDKSTDTGGTEVKTYDVTVTVGQPATRTVDGDVRTDVDDTALDKSIATYSTDYKNEPKEATTTRGEKVAPSADLTNVVISTSEADSNGNYYYLLLDSDGKIDDTTDIENATKFTVKTQTNGNQIKYALVANNGRCLRGNNSLYSDTSTYYSFYYNENYGFYYRYQKSNKTIVYSSGNWTVGNTSSTDKGYLYSVTTTPGKPVGETTITFKGEAVGETKVTIGGVTYNINVIAEDLSKVTPLKLEYWITNTSLSKVDGTTAVERTNTESKTYNAYYTPVKADGEYDEVKVASDDGVDVTDIAPNSTEKNNDGRSVYYWRCRLLDNTVTNTYGSKTEWQTNDGGDDETTSGVGFTKIRYYGGEWQVFTENNEWVTVESKHQLVAYYLEYIKVSDEVESYASDWGNRADGTLGEWLDSSKYCTLSMQVVYQDSTKNPADEKVTSLMNSKTIVYGYWDKGRGIGTVLLNGTEYEIYKVTAETGAAKVTISESSSEQGRYTATATSFTWDGNETTVWEGNPSEQVSISNNSNAYSTDGAYANLCWDENGEAILLRVYVKAKVTADSLTVHYIDDNVNTEFYTYSINVKKGIYFKENIALVSPNWKTYLTNSEVKNIDNVEQKITADLSKMPQIDASYRYAVYKCVSVNQTEGNECKDVYLHYTFSNSVSFVVDFGLALNIPLDKLSTDLSGATITNVTVSGAKYGTASYSDKTITYKPTKTIDGNEVFNVTIAGTLTYTDAAGKTQTNTGTVTYFVNIIPATSVYYEDSFATFTDGSAASWTTETDGVAQTSTTQALEALGSKTKVYGTDNAYSNSTKYSMGSAHKVTVTSAMASTKGVTWPTATFTFTGTGFDIISLTDNTSGSIVVSVYKGTDTTQTAVLRNVVDNYYGYTYNSETQKWETTDSANPNALYQIPVIKVDKLDYGQYTVVISVFFDGLFNQTGNDWNTFVLDAIRVYDPMGKDVATYSQDGEGYPQYIKLRDELAKNASTTNDSSIVDTTTNNVFFIDGAEKANVATYANYGPNNEVYLAKGQAITFSVASSNNIASIQIGAKAPNGTEAAMNVKVGDAEPNTTSITSATEMYYKIATAGNTFTITNTGDGILSLTNLKITYSTKPTEDTSTSSDSDTNPVMLTSLSDEEVNTAVMSVRALFAAPVVETFEPETFEVSWNSVRKGQTATLTVKTSEDVESIMVDGNAVTEYTTRTERNGFGWWADKVTYRVFTYTVTAKESGDHEIIAFNDAGAQSEPITAALTVKESGSSWWNNLWNNFFGRWF